MKRFFWASSLAIFVFTSITPLRAAMRFRDVTDTAEIEYEPVLIEKSPIIFSRYLDNEGVYVSDVNNDDWPDIFLTGDIQPALYINQKGSFDQRPLPEFDDKINAALFTDYNRDGWTDLIIVPHKGKLKKLPNDEGKFRSAVTIPRPELTVGYGITSGDYNRDGCVDLFVTQFNDQSSQIPARLKISRRGQTPTDQFKDNGNPNYLLKGDCSGFELIEDSIFTRTHWSLAASFVDVNQDGWLDIHVTNTVNHDSLFVNEPAKGDGRTFSHKYLPEFTNRDGMSSEVFDATHDGHPDIFVSNILYDSKKVIWSENPFLMTFTHNPRGHNLLVFDKNGDVHDRAKQLNLRRGGWGWATSAGDFDNDFEVELIQARQNQLNSPASLEEFNFENLEVSSFVFKYTSKNYIPAEVRKKNEIFKLFKDWLGYPAVWDFEGNHYVRSNPTEFSFGRLDARGIARLDYDMDGDLDVIFSQFNKSPVLFSNQRDVKDERWIKVDVHRREIGGVLEIESRNKKRFIPVTTGTDFQSQERSLYHVGWPKNSDIHKIIMRWNNGEKKSLSKPPSERIISFKPDEPIRLRKIDTD